MFLGFGLGSGSKRSDAMEAGKAEPTHHITFSDETEVDAKVMGQNTAFIFFVVEGERVVTAAPLTGNVKWVRRMEKTDEDE